MRNRRVAFLPFEARIQANGPQFGLHAIEAGGAYSPGEPCVRFRRLGAGWIAGGDGD